MPTYRSRSRLEGQTTDFQTRFEEFQRRLENEIPLPEVTENPLWAQRNQFSQDSRNNFFGNPFGISQLFGEDEPDEGDVQYQQYLDGTGPLPAFVQLAQNRAYNQTQTRSALWQARQQARQQARESDMALAAGISAGGSLLGSTMGGMFGMIGQGMRNSFEDEQGRKKREWDTLNREDQQAFQLELDKTRMSQAQEMYKFELGSKEQALAQAGLPAYLAQMPGAMSAIPRVSQRLPGGRLYTSQLAGDPTSSRFMGTPIQASMGWGKLPQFN
jgi:hypothetical protein